MGDQKSYKEHSSSPDQVLQGLVRELKNPLLFIARQAEFSASAQPNTGLKAIEQSAQEALQLIDSYLLSARSEYGQKQFSLEPVSLGSILYDVAHKIDPMAKKRNYRVEVETKYARPVMADKSAALTSLACLAQILLMPHSSRNAKTIHLSAYKRSSSQIVAGVLSKNAKGFEGKELEKAFRLQGNSSMALNSGSAVSGVQLALAENLAASMGGHILPIKHSRMKGLGLELVKSEQLVLV